MEGDVTTLRFLFAFSARQRLLFGFGLALCFSWDGAQLQRSGGDGKHFLISPKPFCFLYRSRFLANWRLKWHSLRVCASALLLPIDCLTTLLTKSG